MTKFLRFTFPYEVYIHRFYERRPELLDADYEMQWSELQRDHFSGCNDALTLELARRGYEARDHAFNVEPLQRAWANEHGLAGQTMELLEIARAQAIAFRPEVVMINPFSIPPTWIRELREEVNSIRMVVARHSAPRADLTPFKVCDLVVTGDRRQVAELENAGIDAALLHHGFDPRVLASLDERKDPRPTVLFTGQLRGGRGYHGYRADVVRALVESDVGVDLRLLAPSSLRTRVADFVRSRGLPDASARAIRRAANPPVFGLEMFRAMREAAIVLNVHGDVSQTDANNLRLWEATGVGGCLLTDSKRNLGSLFELGSEVVSYDSPDDAVEKARVLLGDANRREAIAAAGQQRTLRDHTYERRAEELDELIQKALRKPAQKAR